MSVIVSEVWVILDHRIEPDRLMEKSAWLERAGAEERAYEIREHYKQGGVPCPVEAIEVVRLNIRKK